MFVKTQFNKTNSQFPKIVNLAQFKTIEVRRRKIQGSGEVFYEIYAVSDKREILAKFPEDMKEVAQTAYNYLFDALASGDTKFDMTVYFD